MTKEIIRIDIWIREGNTVTEREFKISEDTEEATIKLKNNIVTIETIKHVM